jgi:5,10-methylenetetrahydromethanopterin reductase
MLTVTGGRPRIGVLFPPDRPLQEMIDVACLTERRGLDELWVAEDCFLHGGLTAAGAVLNATSHLRAGVGLLPVSARNPAIAAMELATLAALHPQRLSVAFGHGVEAWMQQIGGRPPDRIVALREVVSAVRALLHGERLDRAGDWVTLDSVQLERAPDFPPPVLIGTTGAKGLAVAAHVADGIVLPEGSSPAAVVWARSVLPADARTVVYAWLHVDEDGEAARAAMLPTVQAWRDSGMYPNLVSRSGLPPAGKFDTSHLDRVAVVGTPVECARAVCTLSEAGSTSIVLRPVAQDVVGQIEAFCDEVLPLVLAESLSR